MFGIFKFLVYTFCIKLSTEKILTNFSFIRLYKLRDLSMNKIIKFCIYVKNRITIVKFLQNLTYIQMYCLIYILIRIHFRNIFYTVIFTD